MNAFEFIQWQIEDGVARLTLNILHIAMMEEINTALSALTPSPPTPLSPQYRAEARFGRGEQEG